jgi:hypothetical protein
MRGESGMESDVAMVDIDMRMETSFRENGKMTKSCTEFISFMRVTALKAGSSRIRSALA